ncbi:MAG: Wzz/FepE/Etk N-terminal domain-containing protein [Thermodesulfovibrionales bacterium]|nr:Wzz/FepE/Etk N-terminal domain-containing protein [Thermodesulfovibrionales bacterium]
MKQKEEFSEEINLLDYLRVIQKHKKLIILIVAVALAVSVVKAFLTAPVYEARAVITPALQQRDTFPMAGLAAQIGISAPTPSGVTEIVNLLNSNILREMIIKRHKLLDVFFEKDSLSKKSEDERVWAGLRFFQGSMKVNFKQKDNIVELSMQFKDPRMAAEILNYTLTELNNHMSSEAKRVADTNKKHLESLLNDTADPFIKNKIYNIIVQQIEQSIMAEVKENLAFKVIDPPRVPDQRINNRRRQKVMVAFATSLFAGILAAFFKEYVDKIRNEKNGKI